MNIVFSIVFTFISAISFAQVKVQLRDVAFEVPEKFHVVFEENIKMDYDAFHENGKIFLDAEQMDGFPKILYQYYEMPAEKVERSEKVLRNLHDIMREDFKADTLIINDKEDYSIAKYHFQGNTLYEIKSLGELGWLNIHLIDDPASDKNNFSTINAIVKSIKHSGKYRSEYDERMKASGESTKWAIVAIVFFVIVHLIRKAVNKRVA